LTRAKQLNCGGCGLKQIAMGMGFPRNRALGSSDLGGLMTPTVRGSVSLPGGLIVARTFIEEV
jgi:hypothetical protein